MMWEINMKRLLMYFREVCLPRRKLIFNIIYIFILYNVFLLDEEIDAVSKELQKYGIQMPPFQKIGGLLTNNITTDTATLHAAIIAINQAVTEEVCFVLFCLYSNFYN